MELGTNPADSDTDGDGLSDAEELARDADPTLHDYQPPEIDVFRANFYKPSWSVDTTYDLGYSVSDATGVASTSVVQDGDVREHRTYGDYPDSASISTQFQTGAAESLFDGVFGTTVRIRASDRHDNTRERVGLERSNFYGTLAGELGPMADEETASELGLLSGFTAGMGGTARTIGAVIDDPLGFVDGLVQLAEVMNDLGLLGKLLAAMPQQIVEDIQEKQDRNNPYDPQTESERYDAFESGYYVGYGAYYLSSLVVGGQATKSVKSSNQFQQLVDRLDSNGRVTQANRYLDAVKGRTTEPVKKGGYRLGARAAKESYHLSKASAQRILSGARTASGQVRVYRAIRQIDGQKIEDLSPSQEQRLRTMLAHTGDDGVEAVNKMDSDTVEDLLSLRAACHRTGLGGLTTESGSCLDSNTRDAAIQSVVKATDDPDISDAEIKTAVKHLSEMDGVAQIRAVRLLADANSDGIKLITRLDTGTLSKLARNTDQIETVRISDDVLVVNAKRNSMDVTVQYPDDGEQYVRTKGGVGDRDLSELSNTAKGDIVEEEIAPKLAQERGYDIRNPFDTGTEDTGFDVIAKDPGGDWIIVEAKFKSKGGSISKKTWLNDPKKGRQMSDDWIDQTITEMRQNADTEVEKKLVKKLRRAYRNDRVRKEIVAAQNAEVDGQTALQNLRSIGIDRVDIVKLGKVIES